MAVKITVTLDEDRQWQSGGAEQAAEEIMALLTAMKDDGRLSIQSRNYLVPVRDMKVHTGLPAGAAGASRDAIVCRAGTALASAREIAEVGALMSPQLRSLKAG